MFLFMSRFFERAIVRLASIAGPFLAALSFLTVFPVPPVTTMRPNIFGRSVAYFPVVGTLLGIIVAGIDATCGLFLPRSVLAVLDLVVFTLVTGGLHLDGLLDSCDGLFGGRDRERRLEIMRDSRVGSFGVLGGVLVVLLEFAALSALAEPARAVALVLAPTLGRWAMVTVMWVFTYARAEGRGTSFIAGLSWRQVLLATSWTGLVLAVLDAPALWMLTMAGIAALGIGKWIDGKLGGLTGDSYGAICELVTALTLVALSGGLA
jgi:adenosylcobinamide-GDP ribazoletransferase